MWYGYLCDFFSGSTGVWTQGKALPLEPCPQLYSVCFLRNCVILCKLANVWIVFLLTFSEPEGIFSISSLMFVIYVFSFLLFVNLAKVCQFYWVLACGLTDFPMLVCFQLHWFLLLFYFLSPLFGFTFLLFF
jgi:hypothetical protein